MTEKELLELAAKAAGIVLRFDADGPTRVLSDDSGEIFRDWNPLEDDGDALRLAVKLGIHLQFSMNYAVAYAGSVHAKQFTERCGNDENSATRRAIVRAAADIGQSMESTSQPTPGA